MIPDSGDSPALEVHAAKGKNGKQRIQGEPLAASSPIPATWRAAIERQEKFFNKDLP